CDVPLPPPDPTFLPYTTLFRSISDSMSYFKHTFHTVLHTLKHPLTEGRRLLPAYTVDNGSVVLRPPRQTVLVLKGHAEGTLLTTDRKSTRLNSSHVKISYAVFC